MNFISRIKDKWGIKSNWQFLVINIVFAISGSLTVFVRKPLYQLLGIDQGIPLVYRVALYIVIVTPIYFTILIIVATVFGQFRFFWNFEKRFFRKLFRQKNRQQFSK
jgi:hypothetical protein